jgi:hypothetical protein
MTGAKLAALRKKVEKGIDMLAEALSPADMAVIRLFMDDTAIMGARGKEYPYVVVLATSKSPDIADVIHELSAPVWKHPFSAGDLTVWGFGTPELRDAFIAAWGGVARGQGVDFS